ncbi:MAG: hypothetical protein JXQ83_10870, partial [Candidatus Glassbacteria bacterium]|nr:hypothetical protein [Candidatus Glassbacteria bacterium]
PEEVWEGGKYHEAYQQWRRYLITSSAREIARAVHSLDPYVCVSLAARSSVDWAYQSDAQVWWEWVREGILDFVCPMNYTTDPDRFVAVMQSHLPLVRGDVPYYSGIGVYEMEDYPQFEKNVLLGRELGQDGFVAFEIRKLRRMLEDSKAGLTSRPALLPHRAPETRFFFDPSGRETGEGFPVYSSGRPVSCKADVMFRGKIREGIAGIRGDIVLQKPGGETVGKLRTIELKKSSVVELSVEPPGPGRYRLALCGVMALSTGSERPFIVKSFPFEVAAP